MSESTMLIEHGTVLARLKPANVMQAAEADLRLRERKEAGQAEPLEEYAFHARHVKAARSVEHLIMLAYAQPGMAATTFKRNTTILYRDRALLRECLRELLSREEEEGCGDGG